jgi:hypothetical protein
MGTGLTCLAGLTCKTGLAQAALGFGIRRKTVVAYPAAALGAVAEMEMGFQIGLRKSRPVFLSPNAFLYLGMFNDGYLRGRKGNHRAYPFLSAAVAEKTERETIFAGMIGCLFSERGDQGCRLL